MSKYKIKRILTFLYSTIISALFCLFLYLISFKIKINFKESLFLIGLVFILIGIVVLISKNPIKMNGLRPMQKPSEVEFSDEDNEEVVKPEAKAILLGFNSVTIVLSGVLLLIADVFLK